MKISRDDLAKLFEQVDKYLHSPLSLILLDLPSFHLIHYPGAASSGGGDDIDQFRQVFSSTSARLRMNVPFSTCQLSDFPFLFESRLQPWQQPSLKMLKIQVVDRSDALVHKILRNEKKDFQAVASNRGTAGLTFETLIDSFCAIDPSAGDLRRKKQDFLFVIEALFGKTSAMQAETTLAERLGG